MAAAHQQLAKLYHDVANALEDGENGENKENEGDMEDRE